MTPNGTNEVNGEPPAVVQEESRDTNQGHIEAGLPNDDTRQASDTARIFISHKSEDHSVALALRDLLKQYDDKDNPKLTFFISEEIPGGEKWYNWIRTNLRASNLLILIYTDPTRSWDWCFFEAGLFDDLDGLYHRRITCLHSSKTTPPGPLTEYQSFAATRERIKVFVNQFFIGTELLNLKEPVAKWLKMVPEKLENVVSDICKLLDRETYRTDYYCKYLFIDVENPDQTIRLIPIIPANSRVKSDNISLEIFKKKYSEDLIWKDLKEKAEENDDQRWIDELTQAMHQVANGDIPDSVQAVFPSLKGDKAFRPILYRADRMVGGNLEYKILFSEDVTWRLKGVPVKIGSLLTVLVMATRFKYEVIDAFCNAYTQSGGTPLSKTIFTNTRQGILNIISEAQSRGTIDRDSLIDLFHGDNKNQVTKMLDRWKEMNHHLLHKLQEQDTDNVIQYMEELKQTNKHFLSIGIKRFNELIANDE